MPAFTPSGDSDTLDRFVAAQESTYDTALGELERGAKQGHWMWFIFPQLRGLGRSEMSWHYGIAGLDEARRYLAHPRLGPRLVASCRTILAHDGRAAAGILGPVDADKLRSSATLFASVESADPIFGQVLDAFFDGRPCRRTTDRLR